MLSCLEARKSRNPQDLTRIAEDIDKKLEAIRRILEESNKPSKLDYAMFMLDLAILVAVIRILLMEVG